MGCDIHLVLEKKHNGKWIGVDKFSGHHDAYPDKPGILDGWSSPAASSRNYKRFAALAGVRGDGPAPRGLPENLSDLSQMEIEYWGRDGHSHSWLPMAEAAKTWLDTMHFGEREPSDYIKKYPESYFFNVDCSDGSGKSADDYRVVFWFDN